MKKYVIEETFCSVCRFTQKVADIYVVSEAKAFCKKLFKLEKYHKEERILFINLTPHEVKIIKQDGIVVIPAGKQVARCEQSEQCVGELEGVPVMRLVMGELTGLPAPRPGVTYIVSHIVLQKAAGRQDLVKPGELVRDKAGAIIGCRGFCRL